MKLPYIHKDYFLTGAVIGIIAPIIFYGFIWLIDIAMFQLFQVHLTREKHYLYLLSTVINVVLIRYFFINLKEEKTARGLLIVTIAFILSYFFMFYKP